MAIDAGVKQGQISDWLKGMRTPGVDGLVALARAFRVPITEFFPPEVRGSETSDPTLGRLLELRAKLDDLGKEALLVAAEDLLREQMRRQKSSQNGSSAK